MTFHLNRESPNTPYKKPMEKFAMSQKLSVVPGVSELIKRLEELRGKLQRGWFHANDDQALVQEAITALEASTTDNARLRAEVEELRKQVPQRIPKEEWLELPDGNYWVITPEDGEAVIAKKNIHGFYCMGNPLPFNTVQGVFRIAPKPTIDIQPSPVGADISIHEPVRAEEKR